MNRTRLILTGLVLVVMVASIYVGSNPEMAARYAQMRQNNVLSADTKDLIMGGLVLVIGGYFAWFFLIRKERE